MLCSRCRTHAAATADGLCRRCGEAAQEAPGESAQGVPAAAHAAAPAEAALPAPPPYTAQGTPVYLEPAPWSYPAGPTAMLKSPVGLGQAVVTLLAVMIAAGLFALVAEVNTYAVMTDLINGEYGADVRNAADRADVLEFAASVAWLIGVVPTGVVFLVWFHRVRVNAEVFAPEYHSKKRGWVVWSWFVPIVNLWFPRRIALDVWEASYPRVADHGTVYVPKSGINAWWTFWLLGTLTGELGGNLYEAAEQAEAVRSATVVCIAGELFWLVAAVTAIRFVRGLTALQDAKVHGRNGIVRTQAQFGAHS